MPFREWPAALVWIAAALAALMLVDAIRRADWRAPVPEHLRWALATALILLARQMVVSMPGGLTLQYLGAAWLTLLLGYPRALVSMAIVYAAEALAIGAGLSAGPPLDATARVAGFALPLLLLGIAPAWLIWQIVSGCRRWLPPNLFIFLLGCGFLGLLAAYSLPLLLAAAATALLGGVTAPDYWETMLPYALLLAAGEAWLEGMITTQLVVFAPGAVRLFDVRYYLARPGSPR